MIDKTEEFNNAVDKRILSMFPTLSFNLQQIKFDIFALIVTTIFFGGLVRSYYSDNASSEEFEALRIEVKKVSNLQNNLLAKFGNIDEIVPINTEKIKELNAEIGGIYFILKGKEGFRDILIYSIERKNAK